MVTTAFRCIDEAGSVVVLLLVLVVMGDKGGGGERIEEQDEDEDEDDEESSPCFKVAFVVRSFTVQGLGGGRFLPVVVTLEVDVADILRRWTPAEEEDVMAIPP